MQAFLDEIENIDLYPHLCNEQMASKVKALLSKKRIYTLFGRKFKDDDKVTNLLRKLAANQNDGKLWGWWNREQTELWISQQVVEALLDAETEGYKTGLDRQALTDALLAGLNRRMPAAASDSTGMRKNELLSLVGLLRKLDARIDYPRYCAFIASIPDATLGNRLRTAEMLQQLAPDGMPAADSLLALASRTMMGSLYWRDKAPLEPTPRRFAQPDMSDVENTLTAYRILRAAGNRKAELEKIRNYFFEQRKSGSWRNTYESSRIVETIMPDMLEKDGGTFREASLTIDGQRFGKFPLTRTYAPGKEITVRKEGSMARILHSLPTSLERQTGTCGRRLHGLYPVPQGRQARDNSPCRGARRTGGNRNGRFRRRIRHGRDPDPRRLFLRLERKRRFLERNTPGILQGEGRRLLQQAPQGDAYLHRQAPAPLYGLLPPQPGACRADVLPGIPWPQRDEKMRRGRSAVDALTEGEGQQRDYYTRYLNRSSATTALWSLTIFLRHVITDALESVVVKDVVDAQYPSQIAESTAVTAPAVTETVGHVPLHRTVGIGRRRIVEVARKDHRIGRSIHFGTDFTYLPGTDTTVVFQFAQDLLDGGVAVVILPEPVPELGNARSLEVDSEEPHRIAADEQVGTQVVVARIGKPDVFMIENG